MKNKVHIITFGCQMNVYDSEVLASLLVKSGYSITPQEKEADFIVVNTCSVREKAETRAFGRVSSLKKYKEENPDLKIVVVGCMAQRWGEKLLDEVPMVDLVVGTRELFNLPQFLQNGLHYPQIKIAEKEIKIEEEVPLRKNKYSGFVAISRGCNNFCSYCVVPDVRGPEINRPLDQIVKEVQSLAETGGVEVTLLGQNVNSYKDNNYDFADLLEAVQKNTEIKRIRFMTSHPKDLSSNLIDKIASLEKVCEHIHLPLQSGSNRILEKMNRKYTKESYFELVQKAKERIKDLSLTTDLIVGFPSETEDDFKQTLDLVREIEFDSAFMFRYSVRTGTKAALLTDDVPEKEKLKRLKILIDLQKKISLKKNQSEIGKIKEVLTDEKSRDQKSWKGKNRGNKTTIISSEENLLGKIVKVQIKDGDSWTLFGELVS